MIEDPPSRALLIMAKQPAPGTTKTRLLPVLSPDDAAELSQCFLLDAVDLVRETCATVSGLLGFIAGAPADGAHYFAGIAPDLGFEPQHGADLGERLDHVLSAALARGFEQVVAINADSPDLPAAYLVEAFARLDRSDVDVVLGPTDDGGYYLIGVKGHHPRLVTDVEMSTPHVMSDTLAVSDELGLQVGLLDRWYDVDEPDDLDRLRRSVSQGHPCGRHTERFLDEYSVTYPLTSNEEPPVLDVVVVIPALNEAGNIGLVVTETLQQGVASVVVVDNGSVDTTAEEARAAGAVVVSEMRRGYGQACATGSALAIERGAEVIVYIDGDQSSLPSEIHRLVDPIRAGKADMVLGSRVLGVIERGAMPPHQRFGNRLSSALMNRLYGVTVTDLGPFRAIRTDLFSVLDMQEMTYGWPTEMMVKSANRDAVVLEVPVTWRARREGESKVSGTVRGSILAARHILGVTIRYSKRFSKKS
jgi:rSAM/selenodomain-associated transferase 1